MLIIETAFSGLRAYALHQNVAFGTFVFLLSIVPFGVNMVLGLLFIDLPKLSNISIA